MPSDVRAVYDQFDVRGVAGRSQVLIFKDSHMEDPQLSIRTELDGRQSAAFSDYPVRFTADGRSVFVGSFGKIPALLTKVDLSNGARTLWMEAMPADPAGLTNVGPIFVTPDGGRSVYSYTRMLSDLYLVDLK